MPMPDGGSDARSAPPAEWLQALDELTPSEGQIYSFLFAGDPAEPANVGVRLDVHRSTSEMACARYANSGQLSQTDDFWLLQVDLSVSSVGVYPVVYDTLDTRAETPWSLVTLLHRRGGEFVARYHAVSGQVMLASEASIDSWKAGASLEGSVEADFPEHAVSTESCRGGVAADGSGMFQTCTCVDSGGTRSECTPAAGRSACCEDTYGPRHSIQFSFRAERCADMCRNIVGAPNFCSLLY